MSWITLILKYLALAIQIITIIQSVIPTAPGPAKLAVALAALNPSAEEKEGVGKLVSTLVGALTQGGAWVKDQPPANRPVT